MTGLNHLRRLDPGLQRDQLITQIGQPGEQTALPPQEARPDGPSARRQSVRDTTGPKGWGQWLTCYEWRRRPRLPGPGRASVGGAQVDPLIHPDLPAPQRREDAPLGGAPHLRRRYPAAQAASGNAVAERTSSSPDWRNGTFTAQLPSAVSSRHTSPCFPRATGPSDSPPPRQDRRRRARSTASTTPPHHTCARHARTDADQIRPCTDERRSDWATGGASSSASSCPCLGLWRGLSLSSVPPARRCGRPFAAHTDHPVRRGPS